MDRPKYWRVGHKSNPLGFVPWSKVTFEHRFDDPRGEFRTVYAAESPLTAFREVLSRYRLNSQTIARLKEEYPDLSDDDLPKGGISKSWRDTTDIAGAALDLDGQLVDLSSDVIRSNLARRHADLLSDHAITHLDVPEMTTERRAFTQDLARRLYDDGAAAVRTISRRDSRPMVAVFEGRGELVPDGSLDVVMSEGSVALRQVIHEWHLELPD